MSDIWLKHLSATLSEHGLIAYMWNANEDRFQWAGNARVVLGLEIQDQPQNNAQFHKMINPQQAPQRLATLHELMGRVTAAGDAKIVSGFTAHYKIRRGDGAHVDVEESTTMHIEEGTGHKLLCGFLKVKAAEPLVHTGGNAPGKIIMPETIHDSGTCHHGRLSIRYKVDEWMTMGLGQSAVGYLLVVGMDRLSLMNEAFGARYADELIEKTGLRLRQITGDTGYVSRIDGDVFGILFPQAPHNEMAAVAQFMLNNFYDTPIQTSKGPIGISISVGGIALDCQSARDSATLITRAEMAMQAAKEKGRSCFVSYQEAVSQAVSNRMLLESGDEFLRALKDNRVRLAFQPILNSKSHDVTFHECLIRMIDENGKILQAGQFVPAVEKLGLSRLVDQYSIRMAVQELSLFSNLELSVNVSNMTLTNQDWLRSLVSALRDRPSLARRLIIEITESAAITDIDRTVRVVRTLKDLGCRVALDDFGTGYTAFSQIRDMDIDMVKIDKSFIRNIGEDQNHLFIKALQLLADGVNVETVGEGAETMADAQRLAGDGIDHIQGYVFGFPAIERIWLPKNHVFRQIPTEIQKPAVSTGEVHEQVMEDIAAWGYR